MDALHSLPPIVEGHLDTVVVLPIGFSGADVARACRETALQFMNESPNWGKAELAMWLQGPYALATRYARMQQEESLAGGAPLVKDVDGRLVERVLRNARTEVVETLAQVCLDQSSSFVLRGLITGTVVRVEDGYKEPAWAPANGTTRLAERVLSLFAVDYLVRPGDYDAELSICPTCSYVAFDAFSRRRGGHCGLHAPPPASRRRFTIPYPGLEAGFVS